MRDVFVKEMKQLNDMLLEMGKNAQKVIRLSIESLKEHNIDKAYEAIKLDDVVDQLDHNIENKCLSLIALQQPIAKDLRRLGTIIKVITDIERVGDYGVNIAKITLELKDEKKSINFSEIIDMAGLIDNMMDSCLIGFMNEDIELSKKAAMMDDRVDDMFIKIFNYMIDNISKDTNVLKEAANLLFVARHLERAADRITNICERTIYMVTGELVEIN